jgi:vacuolar-type H+-ATPase subunit H
MSSSRIEQIIEEIEDYIEGCRYQPLSTTKIVVNKEEIEELLRELRLKTPDEIKRYQKIIGNKDAILSDAQGKADGVVADAKAKAEIIIQDAETKANEMISDTEIMKQAYGQANATIADANNEAQRIVDEAQNDANNIRMSAISYTDQLLTNLSTIMGNTLTEVGSAYDEFSGLLKKYNEIVDENKRQLTPMENQGAAPETEEKPEAGSEKPDENFEDQESDETEE